MMNNDEQHNAQNVESSSYVSRICSVLTIGSPPSSRCRARHLTLSLACVNTDMATSLQRSRIGHPGRRGTFSIRSTPCWQQVAIALLALVLVCRPTHSTLESDDVLLDNAQSTFTRSMASLGARATHPAEPRVKRSRFPATAAAAADGNGPHVCLAFLSCCDRTDLLNHTLAGVIRHMEEDEPDYLRYEIAWVDNGSEKSRTMEIAESYQIDHALRLPLNQGLAFGMNTLLFNLCTAPYILLLEEDWLYLDELVAPQSPERKRAIATSIALVENLAHHNVTAFNGRTVMGVFLRHESYESILEFPLMDNWETETQVGIATTLELALGATKEESCEAKEQVMHPETDFVDIDYRIFCGDTSMRSNSVWGSYTNGAGLYRRDDLMKIGRMYGEPGDTFHDRYVESNYAYRAAMHNCHAALRLTPDRSCQSIFDPECTGAFHHIGGGRGTRPMNTKGTTCDDMAWSFLGTPMYNKYQRYVEEKTGHRVESCSKEDLEELRQRKFRDQDAEDYRKQVKADNEIVFRKEKVERETMRSQAELVERLLETNPAKLRAEVLWMADQSNDEIRAMADRLRRLADSAHPLQGYWDSHGRKMD